MGRTKRASFLMIGLFLTIFALIGCGNKDNGNQAAPNPAPAPAPTTPLPAPTTPIPPPSNSIVPGTNCPSIAADRNLRQDGSPFLGQLQGNNSLAVSVFFSRYSNYDTTIQTVVGAGQFSFPDISYFSGIQIPNQNYNICLSSMGYNNSPVTQGTFNMQDLSVALYIRGFVNVPLYSPYGSYPGSYYAPGSTTPTTGQETIELAIGNGRDCPAYLYQGRIYGCIEVRIGQRAPFRMQSR